MAQLLLVNPSKRRRRKKSSRRKGRMPAGLARYWATHSRGGKKRRHTASRKRRRHSVTVTARANPVRRRRRRHVMRSARRHYRRARSNPIFGGGMVGNAVSSLMSAVTGAGGAIANDIVFGFLPLPATMKAGNMGIMSKVLTTFVLGMALAPVAGRKLAHDLTSGALTVQMYAPLRGLIASMLPNMPLGYYGAGYALNGLNAYISDTPSSLSGMDAYINDTPSSLSGLGGFGDVEVNPLTGDFV